MNPHPFSKTYWRSNCFIMFPRFSGVLYIWPKKNQWNVPTYRSQFHSTKILRVPIYRTSWYSHTRSATDEGTPAPDWIDFQPSNKWIRSPDRIVSTWNTMHHTSEPELFKGSKKNCLPDPFLGKCWGEKLFTDSICKGYVNINLGWFVN